MTLEEALAQSLNTASVRLAQQAGGPRAVAAVARRLGIASVMPDDLSLALGTGEVGLLELASAYATIFNGGRLVTPSGIESAEADRSPLAIPRAPMDRVIDSDRAAEMTRMLAAVVTRGSGKAASIPGRFVAGKTGTTQDFRDAWFVGESGTTVIAVWLGNDDGHPMRNVSGSGLPARLFRDVATDLR